MGCYSTPTKKKKKKHKHVVDSPEPIKNNEHVIDPNSISISDAETESGSEHVNDNNKNDTERTYDRLEGGE